MATVFGLWTKGHRGPLRHRPATLPVSVLNFFSKIDLAMSGVFGRQKHIAGDKKVLPLAVKCLHGLSIFLAAPLFLVQVSCTTRVQAQGAKLLFCVCEDDLDLPLRFDEPRSIKVAILAAVENNAADISLLRCRMR